MITTVPARVSRATASGAVCSTKSIDVGMEQRPFESPPVTRDAHQRAAVAEPFGALGGIDRALMSMASTRMKAPLLRQPPYSPSRGVVQTGC